MHRVLVALLAAFDAVLAAAGGIAVVLAPLTLLWVVALGQPDWGALWPATAAVWHLGHLVPVGLTLPDTYLAATGVDPSAATFTLSLAPLAFAAFMGLFAARSGVRAAEAGAALTGWIAGSLAFAGVAAMIAFTSAAPLVSFEPWQAVLFPALFFSLPSLVGALVGAWHVGDDGPVDALRARIEALPGGWGAVPGLALRGLAVTVLGLVAVGALVVVAGIVARGTQVIALYQASNVDVTGAIVLALGQLVYLPTLVVWGVSFAAGPGFAVGTDTAVTPAATQVGVLPGVPILGAVPESTTSWLLLLVLLPIGVGALAGFVLRSRLPSRGPDPIGPRVTLAVVVAALTGGVGALLAVVASGSIGPGRLADTGPAPGPLALALGLEVLVGLAILLLSPRPRSDDEPEPHRADRERAGLPAGLFATHLDDLPTTPDATAPGAPPVPAGPPLPVLSVPTADDPASRPTGIDVEVDGWSTASAADEDDDVRARIRDAWSRPEPLPGEWGHDGEARRD